MQKLNKKQWPRYTRTAVPARASVVNKTEIGVAVVRYEHQVAGHGQLLSSQDGSVVLKPRIEQELKFYMECRTTPLARHVPKLVAYTKNHVVLECLTHEIERPYAMDVKIGFVLHAQDASPEKALKMTRLASSTSSGRVGFRLCGMRYWVGNELRVVEKEECKRMGDEEVRKCVFSFLEGGLRSSVVGKLKELRRAASSSRAVIVSASVLIVHDLNTVKVKLIDFAHSSFLTEGFVIEKDFVLGLDRFISFLERD